MWRITELPYSHTGKQQETLQDNAEAGNLSDTMGFADSLAGTSSFMISLIWPFPVPFCGAVGVAVSCPFVSFDLFKKCKAICQQCQKNNNNKFHLIIVQHELVPA